METRFRDFVPRCRAMALLADLREGLVGADASILGPYNERRMVYADYVASGRALHQIERFMLEDVLPYYANSHTEASYCGSLMTRTRRETRAIIGASCDAARDHAVIFTGTGATSGINRLVKLFGVADAVVAGKGVRVIIGVFFTRQPTGQRTLIRDLAAGAFVADQRNIVLVGGTGTGKSHLAIAIARSLIRNGARGRFFNVVDLGNRLETETRAGRQGRIADHLTRLGCVRRTRLSSLCPGTAGCDTRRSRSAEARFRHL